MAAFVSPTFSRHRSSPPPALERERDTHPAQRTPSPNCSKRQPPQPPTTSEFGVNPSHGSPRHRCGGGGHGGGGGHASGLLLLPLCEAFRRRLATPAAHHAHPGAISSCVACVAAVSAAVGDGGCSGGRWRRGSRRTGTSATRRWTRTKCRATSEARPTTRTARRSRRRIPTAAAAPPLPAAPAT